MRTHPPTLLTTTRRTIADDALFGRGDRVLVAVSGGPDSMALLHVLACLRAKIGHLLVAHGVDHGLRLEAAGELDLAERLARELDVPFGRTRLQVAPGGNLQARARDARYDALREAAAHANATVVATAHHADDRAETLLLRLLRGAGPAGLAVMPPRASRDGLTLVRPFIRARRADIELHLSRHGLPFATDPSNRDTRFLRARVRAELLPLLSSLSPSIVGHLCALADQLAASGADPLAGMPRATREALARLARTRSTKARVALGPELVARCVAGDLELAAEPAQPALDGTLDGSVMAHSTSAARAHPKPKPPRQRVSSSPGGRSPGDRYRAGHAKKQKDPM